MQKPLRTIVYMPLTLEGKFVKYKQVGMIAFADIKVGDMFVVDKRPAADVRFSKMKQYKVASVVYSCMDRGNIVELEPKDFKTMKNLERF